MIVADDEIRLKVTRGIKVTTGAEGPRVPEAISVRRVLKVKRAQSVPKGTLVLVVLWVQLLMNMPSLVDTLVQSLNSI